MDQKKIGKFIADCRKAVGLTQMQLAEKLNITDRAVSKWETGKALPDSAIMLQLCQILNITVNDLLTGEIISMENYDKQTEKILLEAVKQKEESDKRMLKLEWVIGILSVIIILVPALVSTYIPVKEWVQVLIALSGFIPGLIGLSFAIKIEQIAGYYECQNCGHRYVPRLGKMYISMHFGRTRYLKCPNCGKKSWQKKVISKNKEQ